MVLGLVVNFLPIRRVSNLGTTDIWARQLFVGEFPEVFNAIPGLYLLDDSSIPPRVMTTRNVSKCCQLSPRKQTASLVENLSLEVVKQNVNIHFKFLKFECQMGT